MNSFKRFFLLLAFLLAAGFSIQASSADAPPVRVLPLGDSITLGCCSGTSTQGGYRTRLYSLLTAEGFNVDFVGTLKDGNNPALPDVDHEGQGGASISHLRTGLPVWLKEDQDPDVILLHIGTNDFSNNASVAATQDALKGLIADLATARPFAKIIVSSLIVRTDSGVTEARQIAYNQSLPGIVSEQVAMGRQVYFLDMHGAVEPGDLNEGVHPKITGYEKMADAWLPAIREVITPFGTSNPPTIARVDARDELTKVTVTFSKPVEDAAATVSNYTLSGGVNITAAELDGVSKRTITLTTTTQAVGTLYTLTVSGVRDRTPEHNPIALGASKDFTSRTLLDGSFEANGTGWTKEGSSQVYDALPSTPATDGSKLLVFNGVNSPTGGEVSQTVVTIPGQNYNLGFDVGVFSGGSQSLEVSVKGNNSPVLDQTENLSGNSTDSTLWTSRTYGFTANSLATTVSFRDTSASTQNADLLLDDVRLNLETTPTLTVASTPATGVSVTVSPNDLSSLGNGTTNFTRTYNQNATVNLTAPASFGGRFFDRWVKGSANHSISAATSVNVGVDNTTMTADYRILKNGSFEIGTPANFGSLPDWTLSGTVVTYTTDGSYNATDFSRFLVFNGGADPSGGAVFQTFPTTNGQAYQVMFDLGVYAINTNTQQIEVEVSGITSTVTQTETLARISGDPSLKWATRTVNFVGNGSPATLKFTDKTLPGNVSGADLLLDNVKVTETLANTAPVAVNDSYTTSINVPLTVTAAAGVLANDTDAQNNPLTAAVVANPANGSVTLNTNGGFTYTPNTGYTGSDSFTYRSNDGSLNSNVATVSLTITAVAPGTLTNGSFEQGSPANLGPATGWNFNANYPTSGAPLCYVPDGTYPAVVPDGIRLLIFNAGPDNYTGNVSQSFATSPGQTYSLNLNAGVFTSNQLAGKSQNLQIVVAGTTTLFSTVRTLNSANGVPQLQPLSYSFTADSASTTLTLSDATGALAPSLSSLSDLLVDHVRVALASSNTAPVAVNDAYSTNQNTPLNVSLPGVLTNDTDAQSNPLTAIKVTDPTNGTVSLSANGSFTYTPTSGYSGPDSFTYKANDGTADSNTATVAITVNAPAVTILANGSFESGAIILSSGAPQDAGSVTALDNWGGSGARFGFVQIPEYPATDGQRLLVFNGGYNGGSNTFDGFVTQSFTTTPGLSYTISLQVGIYAGGDNNKVQRLQVKLDGTSNLLTQPVVRTSSNSSSIVQWAPVSFSFIADSATTVLTLSDNGAGFASVGSDLVVDSVQVTANQNSRTLTVSSSPSSGFAVTVSPSDLGGNGNGTTSFTRTYANNAAVTLTAPTMSGANAFQKWQKNGVDFTTSTTANVTMDANYTLNAVYVVNNAPVAAADSYTTNEDTQLVVATPGILANDSDPNSVPITAVLVAGPSNGILTLNPNGSFTYDPTPNYNGADSFTYQASNGTLTSPTTTVSLTVTSVNDLPVAVAQSVQTNEDVPLPITLAATDPDAGPLTYIIVAAPLQGTLSGTGANRTYTPAANYNGADSFTFKVNDGVVDSNTVTVSINVLSVEDIPVANSQTLTMTGATTLPITLTGSDPEGSPVTYTLVTGPTQGILTGTAPNLSYKPLETYVGSDSFTFKVNDGLADSLVATISITVNQILLNGSFEDVSGTSPNFTPNNWVVTSSNASPARYEIQTPIPPAKPTPQDGNRLAVFNTGGNTPNAIFTQTFATTPGRAYTLTFDLGIHTFDIASRQQAMGVTLSGITSPAPATQTITRVGNGGGLVFYETKTIEFTAGTASTTLQLRDLSTAGNSSAVDMLLDKVRVTPKNTRLLTVASSPVPAVNVTVSPADLNTASNGVTGFTRTYLENQVVSLSVPAAIGAQNFQKWRRNGVDFAVTAATSVTLDANYTLTAIYVPNAPPVATADSYSTNEDVALVVPALTGVLANDTDAESVALTAILVAGPTNGTLTLNSNGGYTYTPNSNYFGPDSFTYRASDGVSDSAITTVSLTVDAVNDAPSGVADSYSTIEDTPLVVAASGVLGNDTDVEGAPLTAIISVQTANGSVTLNLDGSFTYIPATNYFGTDSFTYRANDGTANSTPTTVSITVTAVNDAPTGLADSYSTNEDIPLVVPAAGVLSNDTDVDSAPLTAILVAGPSNGTLALNPDGSFTYTPAANYFGADSFTYQARDGALNSAITTVSITVSVVNDAPVAVADSYSTTEDTPLVVAASGLLANDTDVEGSALTAIVALQPANGSVAINQDGSFTYTPTANFFGADSFTYRASDGTANSAATTVSITVTPVNDAPVGVADSYSTNEDTPLVVAATGILANDTDVDADSLTAILDVSPTNGTFALNADGSFTYTPPVNYSGTVSFTYRARDGALNSAITTVSITVNPVNDAPSAVADSYSTNEDTPLVVAAAGVLANDTDLESNPLTATIDLQATNGLVVLNSNGSFTYTPTANYNGTDSFTYRANDGTADSATTTVSISVNAVNDAPTGVADSYSTNEDTPLAVAAAGVLANDTDLESNPLTATIDLQPTNGLVVLNSNGSFTYTPTANYNGADSFTYRANDGTADSATTPVSITVNAVNDAPTGVADSYSTNEDTQLVVAAAGVLSNDTDLENNPLTAVIGQQPANGSVVLNADGSLTYTPTANYFGADSFTYRANDGTADSALTTVSITVNAVNDAPSAVADSYSTNEDTQLVVAAAGVLSNDTDLENNPLTAVIGQQPANGSVVLNANGSFTYTPTANYFGADSFTYRANDGTVDSAVTTVSITVNAVNDAPTGVADSYSTNEDTQLVVAAAGVLSNDTDLENNPLTAVIGQQPANGSVVLNANGSFTYTPTANYFGADSFTYRANDGTVDSAVTTVSITVNAVNDAPTGVADSYSTNEDTQLVVAAAGVLTNDTDVEGSPLTAAVAQQPANGLVVLNANGSFTYTPTANYNGADSFTYRANDGTADSAQTTVSITINAVNDAPIGVADSYSTNEDTQLVVAAAGVLTNDTDVEGSPLTAAVAQQPANGLVVLNANGSFTYTPTANYNGADSFTYRANDGTADSAATTVSIMVNAVNDAPTGVADSYSTNEDTQLVVAVAGVLTNDTDVEGSPLTAAVAQQPTNGLVVLNANGSFTYTPTANYFGADSFTYRANDGTVDSATIAVSITVNSVNDAPVGNSQSVSLDEDASAAITLTGSDQEGSPLTFSVTIQPQNGILSGTAPNLTYTPSPNYNGSDSFTFVANDGALDSAPVVVSISIAPLPDNSFGEWLAGFSLGGGPNSDPDRDTINNALEYVIGGNPANRADQNLLPTISLVTADPDQNSVSENYLLFTYRRTDLAKADPNTIIRPQWGTALTPNGWTNAAGTPGVVILEENDAAAVGIDLVKVYIPRTLAVNGKLFARLVVSIDYTVVNVAPLAAAQSVSVNEDGTLAIILTGTDANNDTLTYTVTANPLHGTLSGAAPNLTYTPAANYNGSDSFTFKVNDGTVDSLPAVVSITVNPLEEFSQWMGSFNLSAGPTVDSDSDTVRNVIEYVVGGNPASGSNANLLPTVSMVTADPDGNLVNDSYLLFTFRRTELANTDPSLAIKVKWGTTLTGAWADSADLASIVTQVTDNGAGPNIDIVSVYIPRSLAVNGKLFARLEAALATP